MAECAHRALHAPQQHSAPPVTPIARPARMSRGPSANAHIRVPRAVVAAGLLSTSSSRLGSRRCARCCTLARSRWRASTWAAPAS
eukprot:1836288-Prymnesium_polylepis.2